MDTIVRFLNVLVFTTAFCLSPSLSLAEDTFTPRSSSMTAATTPTCAESETWNRTSGSCECDEGFTRDARGVCTADSVDTSGGNPANDELVLTYDALSPSMTLDDVGIQVEAEQSLVVTGGDSANPLVVDASPKTFDDWDALFAYLENQLGATLIRDESGVVIAATGKYTRTGSVVFDDDGDEFESMDYVAAYLGGRAGAIEVGGQTIALGADASTSGPNVSYLLQTDEDCDGDSCIKGHSWLTHFLFYHSAGARTKQTAGGTAEVIGYYCLSGELITVNGARQCRVRNEDKWKFDPELREWFPDVLAEGDDYHYVPASTSIHEVLRNELSVAARVLIGPYSSAMVGPKTKINTTEVEIGDWTIIRNALEDDFGNPIPLADITGICGFHYSDSFDADAGRPLRPSVQTSDGSTGDNDSLCPGGDPS